MNQKSNKYSRRHPRERRIWRKDRTALALTIVVAIVVGLMLLISKFCSSTDSIIRGGGDYRKPIANAIECGRNDAMKVVETTPESMERQNALLFIKSRESNLRLSGYNHAADDYINAATDYLKKHNVL